MLRSRSSFLGVLLISSVFATACGPQSETDEAIPADDGQVSAMACTGTEPNLHYVSHDPTECLTISFVCPQGERQFFNECGCGCR